MNKNMKHFLLELLYTSRLILTRDGTIPVWDKKGTPFCHSCDRSFGWFSFKHHCRNISFLYYSICISFILILVFTVDIHFVVLVVVNMLY